jgi:hypothetical protein
MSFNWSDIGDLLAQLEAEARGEAVDVERIRREAERLMALYPGMAGLLAPIAERHSRRAA